MSDNPNSYQQQKLRGLKRKYEAVQMRGGKCEKCGYDKNLAALDFHHRNSDTKEFQIDMRAFSNTNLDTLKEELDKCDLLCANCHREEQYKILKNWEKVAQHFGLTRRIIQGIRKRNS